MSSQSKAFRVGEKVLYPQLKFKKNGKLAIVKIYWQIETIFPVSQLAIIKNNNHLEKKQMQVQVSLAQLQAYN